MSRVVVGLFFVGALACSIVCSIIWMMSADAVAQAPAPSNQKTSNANSNSSSEEAAIFERILNRVHFENDGTEVSETEAVVRIQSQAGVEEFGQLVFGYSSATEKLEVEYVRVRKPDGQVVVTPESTAQDFAPDVLKEAPMYSDSHASALAQLLLSPATFDKRFRNAPVRKRFPLQSNAQRSIRIPENNICLRADRSRHRAAH